MICSAFLSSADVLAGVPWHARTPPALQALSLSFILSVFLPRGCSEQNCGCCRGVSQLLCAAFPKSIVSLSTSVDPLKTNGAKINLRLYDAFGKLSPAQWPPGGTRFNLQRESYLSWIIETNCQLTSWWKEHCYYPVKCLSVFPFIEKMTSSGRNKSG